jgi:hypothetical protein
MKQLLGFSGESGHNLSLAGTTSQPSLSRKPSTSQQTPMHSIDEVSVVAAIQCHIGNEEPGDLKTFSTALAAIKSHPERGDNTPCYTRSEAFSSTQEGSAWRLVSAQPWRTNLLMVSGPTYTRSDFSDFSDFFVSHATKKSEKSEVAYTVCVRLFRLFRLLPGDSTASAH